MRKWETYGLEDDEWDEDDPVFENYFPVVDTLLVIVNDEKYEEESLEGGCAGLRVVEEVDVPGMEIGELRKRCEELKISVWFVEAL